MKNLLLLVASFLLFSTVAAQSAKEEKKPAETSLKESESTTKAPIIKKQKPAKKEKKDKSKIKLRKDDILSHKPGDGAETTETPKYDNATVGIGIGIPYGFFGFNGEITPIKKRWWELMSIVAGIGMTPNEKFAYNAGLRFYLLHPEQIIRPRITITYGTNAYIDVDKTIMENGKVTGRIRHNETAHGVNISAGARVMFGEEKRHGLDFDINIIAWSTAYDRIDELIDDGHVDDEDEPFRISISAGYRFAF